MRLNFRDTYDSTSELTYQYMMPRVAYMDEDGTLVKTAAFERLRAQMKMDLPHSNVCCGLGNCNLTAQQFLDNFVAQNRMQEVIYSPVPPGVTLPPPAAQVMP